MGAAGMKIRNSQAYAICRLDRGGWHVRRIVWGRLMGRMEKRRGEVLFKVTLKMEVEKVEATVHDYYRKRAIRSNAAGRRHPRKARRGKSENAGVHADR